MALVVLAYILVCMVVFVWFQLSQEPAKLLVVSVGGLRHDYLAMVPAAQLPFFTHFARYGARAEWLNPTPPGPHATRASLFTGVYPERHGVLGDHFLDRRHGELRVGGAAGQSAADAVWWDGVLPIWSTAVRQWRRTAVVGVHGACSAVDGFEATFCQPPERATGFDERVALVLERLLSESDPFSMGIVHTDTLRSAAEADGAASDGVLARLRALDVSLQRLDRLLLDRNMRDRVNVVIVSDGGLTDTAHMQVISVDALLPDDTPVSVAGNGAACLVYMAAEHVGAAYDRLRNATGVRAYRRGALPARWRLEHAHRAPDLLLAAQPGFYLENSAPLAVQAAAGYDDTAGGAADMRGVLMGRGPGFRAGVTVQQVNAVSVYTLLAALIEVTSEVHSGHLDSVTDMVQW